MGSVGMGIIQLFARNPMLRFIDFFKIANPVRFAYMNSDMGYI